MISGKPNIMLENTLSGNNSIQRLKYFVRLTIDRLQELQLSTQSKLRFRGDILEISLVRSNNDPDCRKIDAVNYIRTGLLISMLINITESFGYKTILRTFPRFDEPDLLAFIYIGNRNTSLSNAVVQQEPFKINFKKTLKPINPNGIRTAQKYLDKYNLTMHSLSNVAKQTDILSTIKNFIQSEKSNANKQSCAPMSPSNSEIVVTQPMIDNNEQIAHQLTQNNGKSAQSDKLFTICSKRNMPSNWVQTGFFLGDIIHAGAGIQHVFYPLNLSCCINTFQEVCRTNDFIHSAEFPQILLFAGDYSNYVSGSNFS